MTRGSGKFIVLQGAWLKTDVLLCVEEEGSHRRGVDQGCAAALSEEASLMVRRAALLGSAPAAATVPDPTALRDPSASEAASPVSMASTSAQPPRAEASSSDA